MCKLPSQNKRDIYEDLEYCIQADPATVEEIGYLENMKTVWREPNSLRDLLPDIIQLLKSRKFTQNGGDDPKNLVSSYEILPEDDTQTAQDKVKYMFENNLKPEYENFSVCVKEKEFDKCFIPTMTMLVKLQSVVCRKELTRCLQKMNFPYGSKLEETPADALFKCSLDVCMNVMENTLSPFLENK